jgi:hypothetical protein
MSFEKSLSLEPPKIAVKGTALGKGSKQDINVVGSQVVAALREDSQDLRFGHGRKFIQNKS